MVKMLTVLISTISNSQVFLLKKMRVSFAFAKATHIFFSKTICLFSIFNDQCFNDTLTNDFVSFEQPGPVFLLTGPCFLLQWLPTLLSVFFLFVLF